MASREAEPTFAYQGVNFLADEAEPGPRGDREVEMVKALIAFTE